MRKFTVTLTESQYAFVKAQGRGWLKDIVQLCIDHPSMLLWNEVPEEKKPWWRFR